MITKVLILFILATVTLTQTSCPPVDKRKPCKQCPKFPIFFDNKCVASCPPNFVVSRKNGYQQCQYCDISKSLLPNKEKNQCVCAIQHYITPFNGECLPCHYSCLTCTGPNENNCDKCSSSQVQTFRRKRNQGCVCLDGFTENPQHPGLKCEPCHQDCAVCSGPEDSQCIKCASGKVKDEFNLCVCPENFIENSGGQCVCPSPYVVKNRKCLEQNSSCGPNQIQVKKSGKLILQSVKSDKNKNQEQKVKENVQCVCKPGLFKVKGICRKCGPNEQYNQKTGKCRCVKEATRFKNSCIICQNNQKFNKRTGECTCKKNEQKNQRGQCIRCKNREVYKDGECKCIANYYRDRSGRCKKCNSRRDNPVCRVVTRKQDEPKVLQRSEIQ